MHLPEKAGSPVYTEFCLFPILGFVRTIYEQKSPEGMQKSPLGMQKSPVGMQFANPAKTWWKNPVLTGGYFVEYFGSELVSTTVLAHEVDLNNFRTEKA